MPVLDKYISHLNQLKEDIPIVAADIVTDNSEAILNLVKFGQLGIGLDSFGQSLSFTQGKYSGDGFYTEATEKLAEKEHTKKSKITGKPYNFEWTGDTFRTMFLKSDFETSFTIFTKDGKQKLLEGLYGEIFKLTEKHNKIVNETIILPELYKYFLENMFAV